MKKNIMKAMGPPLFVVGSLLMAGCTAHSITLALAPDQTLQTGQTVVIDVQTSPPTVKINPNSITISGGESWVEGGVIKFKAMDPGNYTMRVDQDSVASNELTIPVIERPHASSTPSPAVENPASSSPDFSTPVSPAPAYDPLKDAAATVQKKKMSVEEVYTDQNRLIEQQNLITVNGQLPQSAVSDQSGQPAQVLWNAQTSQYLILEGFDIPFGGCPAQVTGTLSRNANGELVLHMSYISTDYLPSSDGSPQPSVPQGYENQIAEDPSPSISYESYNSGNAA